MVLITVEVPEELDKKIAIDSIEMDLKDKRKVILQVLEAHYLQKKGVRDGG